MKLKSIFIDAVKNKGSAKILSWCTCDRLLHDKNTFFRITVWELKLSEIITFMNVEVLKNIKVNMHFTFIFNAISSCLQCGIRLYSIMNYNEIAFTAISLIHQRNDKTVDTWSQQRKINYRNSLSFALSVRNYDTYSPTPATEINFLCS